MGYSDSLNPAPKPPTGLVGQPTDNLGTRVSPTTHSDDSGRPYREKMMKMSVKDVTIDIDREGGVFLDHDELAKLLETGTIDGLISEIKNAIKGAKLQYTQRQPAELRYKG